MRRGRDEQGEFRQRKHKQRLEACSDHGGKLSEVKRRCVGVQWVGVAAEDMEFRPYSVQEGKQSPSQPRERSARGRPSADVGCSPTRMTHSFR